MSDGIAVALITVAGSILVAIITAVLTQRKSNTSPQVHVVLADRDDPAPQAKADRKDLPPVETRRADPPPPPPVPPAVARVPPPPAAAKPPAATPFIDETATRPEDDVLRVTTPAARTPTGLPPAGHKDGVVRVTDSHDVEVELTETTTESIDFTAGDVEYAVPVASIVSIRRAGSGKALELRPGAGHELTGTCDSKLEGVWEVGKYSVPVADIKTADFGRGVRPPGAVAATEQPDGFVARCKTRAGSVLELQAFVFVCSTSSSGWMGGWSTSHHPATSLPLTYERAAELQIPFADIAAVTFTDDNPSPQAGGGWKLAVRVSLRDGTTLTGTLSESVPGYTPGTRGYGQRFSGTTAIGTATVKGEHAAQVVLDHDKSKNAPRPARDKAEPGHDVALTTWGGTALLLRTDSFETAFSAKVGGSVCEIAWDKTQRIVVDRKGDALARVTLAGSGKVLEVTLETKYLRGTLTDLGRSAAITLGEVSELRVLRTAGQ